MKKKVVEIIKKSIEAALPNALERGIIPQVQRPPKKEFGDFATPVALSLAKLLRSSPGEIAKMISEKLKEFDIFEWVKVEGPGYINLKIRSDFVIRGLKEIFESGKEYGKNQSVGQKSVLFEFVSANPTGPLHVGHGRGAVVGDVLAAVYEWCGYRVIREYYVNDAGHQIDILRDSIKNAILEMEGKEAPHLEESYKGTYIKELARLYKDCNESLPVFAVSEILGWIKKDLSKFGINFDRWIHESRIKDAGRLDEVLKILKDRGYIYEEDGKLIFKSRLFGDDKDRVMVRSDGSPTYFGMDSAYHLDKFKRGFDLLINVWGADHHGYIPRMKAVVEALGYDRDRLRVITVQMVRLMKGNVPVTMSKREGKYEYLRDLIEEVGRDAARFIFLTKRNNSPLVFDIELAKQKNMDNPVYYAQYGYARICSILRRAEKEGLELPEEFSEEFCSILTLPEELTLAKFLLEFPDILDKVQSTDEPHLLVYYLLDLIKTFHSYYTKYRHTDRVIDSDLKKTNARLFLVECVRIVLSNIFDLIGISAPTTM